ncbi:CoxG family protein [Oceanobacillus halophilus]|uniref:SRPBCC family protein n=1 Tax=Oceanobacillus halophilus TaxID=930130 RepID=A0A494ZS19_9BACI|nr:SRPBCC family protein [Oceanobacillus halophilus]RKQ28430.1 SRPBCC family protein [Oceanobacillus halophilus]
MANGKHTVVLNVPIQTVWDFVSDINNWAPLVPGYIEHKIMNDSHSTWKFVSDIGFMKKTLHMKNNITKWEEPTKVTFLLEGLNENFSGSGFFEAKPVNDTTTKITGQLDITAGGFLAPAINPALKSVIPKTASELTNAVAEKVKKISK